MHKTFYASGFLYHPKTQQILLQQLSSVEHNNAWSMFIVKHNKEESLKDLFLEIINNSLNLNLKSNSIFSVYNYSHQDKNMFIFYAQINKMQQFIHESKTYAWFTFKQIQKLSLSEQTKQDIIISQRVINSFIRKKLGLQTIG